MADDAVEIITQEGRFSIPAADLEAYRTAEEAEVEGFGIKGFDSFEVDKLHTTTLTLQVGKRPIVRSNGYIAFAGETLAGDPF